MQTIVLSTVSGDHVLFYANKGEGEFEGNLMKFTYDFFFEFTKNSFILLQIIKLINHLMDLLT